MITEYSFLVGHVTILKLITNTFVYDQSHTFVEDASSNKEYWVKLINHFFGYECKDPFAENLVMNGNSQAFADAFAEIINYRSDFDELWKTPIDLMNLERLCTFMPRLSTKEIDLFYSKYSVNSKLEDNQIANPFLLVAGNSMPGFKAQQIIHHSFHPNYYSARCEIIKHGVSEVSVYNFKTNKNFNYDAEQISIKSYKDTNFKYEWYTISDIRVNTSPTPCGYLNTKQ